MTMRRKEQQHRRRLLRSLAALVLAAGAGSLPAEDAPWGVERQDPMWISFVPHLRYIKTDVEVEDTTYDSKAGGGRSDYQRVYVAPAFGIGWDYFIYHPDLFVFSILAEPGYDWENINGSGYSSERNSALLNGSLNGILLREKPYATTVNYARSHDEVHYDFYNSATTDAENIGVTTGYREGPVPVSVSLHKSDSDSVGYHQETINDQLTLDVHARNERKKQDATDLTYQFSELNYQNHYQLVSSSSENTYHHVALSDVEHFSRSTLSSGIIFYDINSARSSSQNLNASVGYNYDHTPHLHSFYDYALSTYTGNGTESVDNFLTVGLAHQLYESLASGVNVHGSTANSSSFGSTLDSYTIGVGESEDYTKRLGDWGRLSLGNNVSYDVTSQQSAGSQQFVPDESHVIPTTGPMIIRLKVPRDVSISSVKKNNIELDPSEWQAIKTSDPWQIQFFTTPINNVQPGDTVTVSYTAQSNPSGSYATINNSSRVSLRFWQERAEIYASYNFTRNEASSAQFLLQNFNAFEAGASGDWRGFHARASYVDQHSTLYDYQSLTLNEGYAMPVFSHSSAGIELSQQWNVYPPGSGTSTNRTQTGTFYSVMAHYDWHPLSAVTWNIEAGYQRQGGLGYDQNLFAARTYLNWTIGKLELHLGYEHDNQEYVAEKRQREFVFLRMRRNF
jgi:hypothetical protein